ncbi:thioredoxin family protein [Tessaracoccus lubricantis]|uniref:Thioredoxin family protein n=1 Tax=Tessaracoccus lubricantis TaxID=545543 RepID=A0ABP9FES0_9ACTN
MTLGYLDDQPTREEVDATSGLVALEFGQNWCGYCAASAPALDEALGNRPDVKRIKVADGKGLPLGRSFRVKLWPTMILLRDGREVARVVRPETSREVDEALDRALPNVID